MATQYSNKPIVTNGLVYALDFGNPKSYTTGSNRAVSLAYNPATTIVTGSTAIPTLSATGLTFSGAQWIQRSASLSALDPNGTFTICAVVKANTSGTLFTQNSPVGNLSGRFQSTSSLSTGFTLASGDFSRVYQGIFTGSQHVTYRYSSGSFDTFINGIPVTASVANAALTGSGLTSTLFINSGSLPFSGSLSSFYVYNRALTPDEIYQNFQIASTRYGLPYSPKPYTIDENLYQFLQTTGITDTVTTTALATFISGLKSNGLWNKMVAIYPFVSNTTSSLTTNLKEPGLYRLGLTGSFSASSAGLTPSSSTAFIDTIPGNTTYASVNSQSAHLTLLSYDLPTGNGFLAGNSLPALGGDVIIASGSKIYHAFKTVGTSSFTMLNPAVTNVEVMVVAGGGGGSSYLGSGGNAGQLIYSSSFNITPNTSLPVVVGAGGPRNSWPATGISGSSSSFSTITATGGTGGPQGFLTQGGSGSNTPPSQSYGGSGSYYPQYAGIGLGSPSGWFGGGGGGSASGPGGIGGGGNGVFEVPLSITDGVSNTGGGGGGSYQYASISAGAGGSGIVIVSYNLPASALTGSGTGIYLTDTAVTASVNSQFTSGITGSGNIGLLTVSRTGSGTFSIHKNNVSQSIASASLGALPTDIFFNTANLAGSGSLPLQAGISFASIGSGLTTTEVATYHNLVGQLQTNLKRLNTLLDNYTGAAAAYSLRRIGPSGYFGPAIKVRRDSDNTLRDIGFTSDGQLDTVALLDFVGVTGSGFVQTWYDQSGNGNNASQATAGSQPLLLSSGSIITRKQKPYFQSSPTQFLRLNSPIVAGIADYSWWITYEKSDSSNTAVLLQDSNNYHWLDYNTTQYLSEGINTQQSPGQTYLINTIKNYPSSLTFYRNSVSAATTTPSATPSSTTEYIPANSFRNTNTITLSEFIYYPSNQFANKTTLDSNINNYYKIYGSATASFDPDYSAFITATGITQPTQSAALETLVSDLKSYGLWTKMKAIYPMITDKYNLYSNTENLSTGWLTVSSSLTASNAAGPFTSSLVANRLVEGSGTVTPAVYQTVTLVSGSSYVMSTYARWNGRDYLVLNPDANSATWFDIKNGYVSSSIGTAFSSSIQRVSGSAANPSGSWYRCSMMFNAVVSTAQNTSIQLSDADGVLTYTGGGASGSYLWGTQFENGTFLSPYLSNTTNVAYTTASMLDQMKYNLKNPANTNAAYRLTPGGIGTVSYTGYKGDGVSGYLDTNLVGASVLVTGSTNLSVYVRSVVSSYQNLISSRYGALFTQLATGAGPTTLRTAFGVSNYDTSTFSGTLGFALVSRTNVNNLRVYRNNSLLLTVNNTTADSYNSTSFTINAQNSAGTIVGFSKHETAFATIGDGLTDYEAKALYWIVQKYQTTLGRQVY